MFRDKFPWPFAHERDEIVCHRDGLRCVATIKYDDICEAPDSFWPSLVSTDHGYIGHKHPKRGGMPDPRDKARLRRATKHAQAIMNAWAREEWYYVGVIVNIYFDDGYAVYQLGEGVSLWGIECNYPSRQKNSYLTTVANELLPDAIDEARASPRYAELEFQIRCRAATTMPRMKLAAGLKQRSHRRKAADRRHTARRFKIRRERRMLALMWCQMGAVRCERKGVQTYYFIGEKDITFLVQWLLNHNFVSDIGKLTSRGKEALHEFAAEPSASDAKGAEPEVSVPASA